MNKLICLSILFVVLLLPAVAYGDYIEAKMPMTVVHPRPDSETPSYARHRKAYPDGTAEYRIPVSVQGGAYPHIYSLEQGPEGMTIGETHNADDYGVVTWTPDSAGGPYDVEVKITDQEGSTVTATWTVRATTDGFIFLDTTQETSGDGTKESPFNDFADIHLNSDKDDTYYDKIVYVREGTHMVNGQRDNNNFRFDRDKKPETWIGYTGEDVILDFSETKMIVADADDFFVGNLTCKSARTDVKNAHFFWVMSGSRYRHTWFEVDFEDISRGTKGNDNPACIFFNNPHSHMREYFTLWGCTQENYDSPIIDIYATKYGVVDNNRLGVSSTARQGIFLKSDDQNWSVRRNEASLSDYPEGAINTMMQAQSFTNDKIEICYNLIESGDGIRWNWWTSEGENNNPSIYVYRNTIIGGLRGLDGFLYTVYAENNVVLNNNDPVIQESGEYRVVKKSNNITGSISERNNILDENYELKGEYERYKGTHGHVISKNNGLESRATP